MDPSSGKVDGEADGTGRSQLLSPATIGRFLIGDRDAIEQVTSCPSAVRLGLVFVISAGFAREYDGQSLLQEPWHLLLPLGASLITSYVLFLMVSLVAFRRGVKPFRTPGAYRSFLGLFWMTAPMAWLYAIPVERCLSTGNATAANLMLLGVVAVWRVVLMIRVITVVFGARTIFHVVSTVMLFADLVMLITVFVMPTPIWSIMGGVRLTESEQIIVDVSFHLKFWGIVSLPVWLIGFARACRKQPAWDPMLGKGASVEVGRSSWALAFASLLIWIPVLPFTQSEQRLRFQVERDLAAERIDEALRRMSDHQRTDFPPHWDPPPRPGYGVDTPNLYSVMESIATGEEYRPWVRDLYTNKFMNNLSPRRLRYLKPNGEFGDLQKVVGLLERIPEGRQIFAVDHRQDAQRVLKDSNVPPSLQQRVRALADLPDSLDPEQSPSVTAEP